MRADDVLSVARRYIGYTEKASNSQLENFTGNAGSANYTMFALRLYDAGYYNGNKNGYAWCDCFVDYCFYEAADYDADEAQRIECQTGDLGAGCLYSAGYYKAQGRFDMEPRPGDQIFFLIGGSIGHTGIVESVSESSVITIEGNSGDMVQRHSYVRGAARIAGYGHPRYDNAPSPSSAAPVEAAAPTKAQGVFMSTPLPLLKYGAVGLPVRRLQALLNESGCRVTVDGDFGIATRSAVRTFQAAARIDVDGEVGSQTWGKLINGG